MGCTSHHKGEVPEKFRIWVSNYRNFFRFIVTESHVSGLLGLDMCVYRTNLYCVTREGRKESTGADSFSPIAGTCHVQLG